MSFLSRLPKSVRVAILTGSLLWPGGLPDTLLADPAAATPPPASPAAPATSFDEVTARLDRGGSFYLYLSAAQWLEGLSGRVDTWRDLLLSSLPKDQPDNADRQQIEQGFNLASKFVRQSGLEQITGFGASFVTLEPGLFRNVTFVHHGKDTEKGLFATAFGAAPHALPELDLLPADTALASYGDFDLARVLTTVYTLLEESGNPDLKKAVDDGLAKFTMLAGMPPDAALASLGGSQGIILTLDPAKRIDIPVKGGKTLSMPLPRLALLVRTNDDRIFQRLDLALGFVPNVVKTDEPGLRMRRVSFPALPNLTLHAAVAQWDNLLVITSDEKLIRDLQAAQKSGNGLKSTPVFAKLAAGLPTEGNGFSVVTARFGETLNRVRAEMMTGDGGMPPEQKALMEKFAFMQDVSTTYSVRAHLDNGWLSVSKGSRGIDQVLLPLAAVPAALMAAGIANSASEGALTKGKASHSLANAKQIALACKLYAGDHDGKFPPTLDDLLPTYLGTRTIFVSPFAPGEPMGYTYTPGLTDNSPPDTVLLEDKHSVQEHQRVVVHVDCSGEVTKAQ